MRFSISEKNKITSLWYLSLGMFYFSIFWILRNLTQFKTIDFVISLILSGLTSVYLIAIAKLYNDRTLKATRIRGGVVIFALVSIIGGSVFVLFKLLA